MGKKGLVLFTITVVYNLTSVLFANLFEPSVFLGIGIIIIWFLYGIWGKEGFKNGIVIGGLGASGFLSHIIFGATPLQIISFSLWGYPFWFSLMDITDYNQKFPLSDGLVMFTFVSTLMLSIFFVAIGSWIGARRKA